MLGRALSLPLDLLSVLRQVPGIARDTNRMADATTSSLPALEREIARVAEATEILATMDDPVPFHGAYVVGRQIAEPDRAARDDELGERLWAESARLVGL